MEEASVLDVRAEAKVYELSVRPTAAVQKDVFQLDVAVHDVQRVHVIHLHAPPWHRVGHIRNTSASTHTYLLLIVFSDNKQHENQRRVIIND